MSAGPPDLAPAGERVRKPSPFKCFDTRYLGKVLAASLLVILISLASRWADLGRGTPLRIGAGLMQALLIGYTVVLTVRSIRKLDEMQYRMHLESIAFSFAASATVMTGWAFLSKAGLPEVTWGYEAWPMMVLFWALGLLIVRRRYL
jgi:hypothetical protein